MQDSLANGNNDKESNNNKDDSLLHRRFGGICNDILDAIGYTPLVRLNRVVPSDVKCQILAKCEFFNAGGSVKDRIGKQMVLDAESSRKIKSGDILIEPTSGNTGIGLALTAAVKGYKCYITMPEKMSKEKVDVLKALGAEIIRTPTEAAYDAPESHIGVARKLQREMSNSHILDQYANPSNPDAHYKNTAEEIIQQTNGKIDMLVAGAGTGGTISGLAKRLKEHNPDIIIVGVDPHGSILAQPDSLNDFRRLQPYHVEGIGYDFVPNVLNRDLIDEWIKSNDRDSCVTMRKLIRYEGLLCGGSSGAAVHAAIKAAKQLGPDQTCVVILPDSVRNYMTKALSDDWMSERGFVDGDIITATRKSSSIYNTMWWANRRVCDLMDPLNTPLTITSDVSCKEAISLLKKEGFDMVPVLDTEGCVNGVVTEGNMTKFVLSGRAKPETSVLDAGVIYKTFHQFSLYDTLGTLAQALDHDPFALIVTTQRCFTKPSRSRSNSVNSNHSGEMTPESNNGSPKNNNHASEPARVMNKCVVSGIVTRIDLLDYISSGEHQQDEQTTTTTNHADN